MFRKKGNKDKITRLMIAKSIIIAFAGLFFIGVSNFSYDYHFGFLVIYLVLGVNLIIDMCIDEERKKFEIHLEGEE